MGAIAHQCLPEFDVLPAIMRWYGDSASRYVSCKSRALAIERETVSQLDVVLVSCNCSRDEKSLVVTYSLDGKRRALLQTAVRGVDDIVTDVHNVVADYQR